MLEDHNDVFADIINGLIFKGEQRVRPEKEKYVAPVVTLVLYFGEEHTY